MKKILIAFIAVLAVACTKENEVVRYVDKEYSWKKDLGMDLGDKTMINSFKSNDTLYVVTMQTLTMLTATNDAGKWNIHYFRYGDGNSDFKYRCKITSNFFSRCSNGSNVVEIWEINPYGYPQYVSIDLKTYDSTFAYTDFPASFKSPSIGIIGTTCLISYYTNKSEHRFLLVDLVKNSYRYEVGQTKIVELNERQYTAQVYMIEDFYGRFYVTSNNGTFSIDTNGDVRKLYDYSVQRMLQDPETGKLLLFDDDRVLISSDEGKSFDKMLVGINTDLIYLKHSIVNNRIVSYYADQLWLMKYIDFEGFYVTKLKSDGIEGNYITSINQLGDSLVYVTTLSGGFYKPIGKFFADTIK